MTTHTLARIIAKGKLLSVVIFIGEFFIFGEGVSTDFEEPPP